MLVSTTSDFKRCLRALRGDVSFDTETWCLNPWQKTKEVTRKKQKTLIPDAARVTMFGFGTADGEFSIPTSHIKGSPWSVSDVDEMIVELDEKLRDCFLIMHNGKFDTLWMWVHYGVRWDCDFDTMLADYMCDENQRHGLDVVAKRELGAELYDLPLEEKQGRLGITKALVKYHGLDLKNTRDLYPRLKKRLAKDPQTLKLFDKILMPLSRLYTGAQYDGIVVNEAQFDEAETYLRGQKAEAEAALKKYGDINWGSPPQLANLLYNELGIECPMKTKTGNPSTCESALNQIDHPCVADLIKFRGAKQQLSFFIDGWKPFIHRKRVKGKWYSYLHPSMKLHGTVTGRPSCEDPNLFQVPRDSRIRSLIGSEDGWTFVECDLAQIELRIAAELANEPELKRTFREGGDPHWLTALREIERGMALTDLVIDTAGTWTQDKKITYHEAIKVLLKMGADEAAEINPEWKEYRKKAKAVNFGYLFGMWWKKFKQYARDNYGVEITDEQAQASREFFFETYAFEDWHNRQKSFARRNGYVRSLSGRKRRLPEAMNHATDWEGQGKRKEAERQAINSPVQSFANEINFMSAIQLSQEYTREQVKIVGTVYDAILMRVRDDLVEEVTARLLKIMQRPALFDDFGIKLSVPIEAEAKIGPWGAGISFEKWRKLSPPRAGPPLTATPATQSTNARR